MVQILSRKIVSTCKRKQLANITAGKGEFELNETQNITLILNEKRIVPINAQQINTEVIGQNISECTQKMVSKFDDKVQNAVAAEVDDNI